MTAGGTYETFDFPVRGGTMRAGRWGDPDDPVVVGVHGITANHLNFTLVGQELDGRARLVAPDVRGRGRSTDLPGPYGVTEYAEDLVSLADHLGLDKVRLAGHSMGGYISATAAALHPDRIESVLLIDGGLTLPTPPDFDADAYVEALLGPSIARLSMTFESPEAYRDFWKAHPGLKDYWAPHIDAYVDYDLVRDGETYRSCVSAEAVKEYNYDLLKSERKSDFTRIQCPAWIVRAERGIFDDIPPLFPDALAEQLLPGTDITDLGVVPDTNHYTILLSDRGAEAVAATIRQVT